MEEGIAERLTKHEVAYAEIRRRILGGEYGPGHRLVIDSLARELGVSSISIREAIRRLEAEEWVTFTPHVGAQVRPHDPKEWTSLMSVLAVLSGYATAIAAPYLTGRDFERLRLVNRDMAGALDEMDLLAFTRKNREFHFGIYSGSGDHYLMKQLADAWDRVEVLRQSPFVYRANSAADDHERLLQLIEDGTSSELLEAEARMHHSKALVAFRQRLGLAPQSNGPEPAKPEPTKAT